jgi:hypothetical protein
MRKLFITLVSIFALTGYACSQNAPAAKEDKNAPEISFETLSHDFGTVAYKGNGTFEFVFKNTGKEPLVLSDVRSSCGCTTPEWPKDPIKKGQKAVIKVMYNTNIIGPFTKSIYVTSNGKTQRVELKIKGTVVQEEGNKS